MVQFIIAGVAMNKKDNNFPVHCLFFRNLFEKSYLACILCINYNSLFANRIYTFYRYGTPEDIILKSENGLMICKKGKEPDMEEKDAIELEAAIGFSKVIREISSRVIIFTSFYWSP